MQYRLVDLVISAEPVVGDFDMIRYRQDLKLSCTRVELRARESCQCSFVALGSGSSMYLFLYHVLCGCSAYSFFYSYLEAMSITLAYIELEAMVRRTWRKAPLT
jgi:hypothetical protein